MNFSFAQFGVLSRTMLGLTAIAMAACTSAPYVADSKVFDASPSAKRARFPKMQKIGVVELSGARISSRPFQGSPDQLEYVASGGALLEKRMDSPILAQADEIVVTPEAAILKGKQAMVKKAGQLYTAKAESTEFVIDGTQVKIEGPHSIQDLASGKTKTVGVVSNAPVAIAPSEPVKPQAKEPKAAPSVAEKPKSKPAPTAAAVVTNSAKASPIPPQPKPAPKPASAPAVVKPIAKPAPKPTAPAPKSTSKPAPKVDRQELLNLMREPSE